jgi:putative chitinase
MIDRLIFFAAVRKAFGRLSQSQVDGFNKIIDEAALRATMLPRLAYMLATVRWETSRTMQPVREMGGERYLRTKRYYPWVGEGLVQVTWKENAIKFGAKKPGDLLTWPIALVALFDGMEKGMFTGKKLADYIAPPRVHDYLNARRIINGTDHARDIEKLANTFETALSQSVTIVPPPRMIDMIRANRRRKNEEN